MWVEVISKDTGRKILVNTRFVQSVYPRTVNEETGVMLDFGGYSDNFICAEGSYREIRDLVSDGEWRS